MCTLHRNQVMHACVALFPSTPSCLLRQVGDATAAWHGGARNEPHGMLDAVELPRGADDCLSGETFVITGVLPHLARCARRPRGRVYADILLGACGCMLVLTSPRRQPRVAVRTLTPSSSATEGASQEASPARRHSCWHVACATRFTGILMHVY